MKVVYGGVETDLAAVEANPTISIFDFSRRVTDDFGNTTVVKRGFSRRLSVRLLLPTSQVDALRAKFVELKDLPALWVAHDSLEWLQVEGYYKDFEIDVAGPQLSYCTLSVEGLAETEVVTDSGEDPAPSGLVSTLTLQPDGGAALGLGITEASPTAGINNFSRKVVDDFGEVTVVPRAWAERMNASAFIRTDAIDIVANRIAAVRATPVIWTGQAGLDTLTINGFFKDFSIEVGETVSKLSISIEGMSTAQTVLPPEDLFGGIQTDRDPTPAPTDPRIGSIYFDGLNRPYRFEGRNLFHGEVQLFNGESPLMGSGWVSVRDKGLTEIVDDLQALDDDGTFTTVEKRIAIERDRQLENIHNGVIQQALLLGYDTAALIDAREAYLAVRNSIVPAWNDLTQPSDFYGTGWDAVLDVYEATIAQAQADMSATTGVTVVPPPAQEVRLDQTGEPVASEWPRVLTPVVSRGAVDLRTADDVAYSINVTGDLVATVNNVAGPDKGRITVTAGKAGTIDLTVTVRGVVFGPHTIKFTAKPQAWLVEVPNGYARYELQANGVVFITQYIEGAVTTSENLQTIDFPVAFPNKCLSAAVGTVIPSNDETVDIFYQRVGNPTGVSVQVKAQRTAGGTTGVGAKPWILAEGY